MTTVTGGTRSAGKPTAAVKACRTTIARETSIPASFRAKLAHICDVAGTGDRNRLRQVEHGVCVAVIKQQLPPSAQKAAEASCPRA